MFSKYSKSGLARINNILFLQQNKEKMRKPKCYTLMIMMIYICLKWEISSNSNFQRMIVYKLFSKNDFVFVLAGYYNEIWYLIFKIPLN